MNPTWSPDGKKIAFITIDTNTTNAELSIIDTSNNNAVSTVIPFGVATDICEVGWSNDGKQLAFLGMGLSATSVQAEQLFVINIDGSGRRQLTTDTLNQGNNAVFGISAWGDHVRYSNDGKWIFYTQNNDPISYGLAAINSNADVTPDHVQVPQDIRLYTDPTYTAPFGAVSDVQGFMGDVNPYGNDIAYMDYFASYDSDVYVGKLKNFLSGGSFTPLTRAFLNSPCCSTQITFTSGAPNFGLNNLGVSYSPDGKNLVFQETAVPGLPRGYNLMVADLTGKSHPSIKQITNFTPAYQIGSADWQPIK